MRGVVFALAVLANFFLYNVEASQLDCQYELVKLEKLNLLTALSRSSISHETRISHATEGPLHFSSSITMPFVWLTHPHKGVEYFAVPKEQNTFGFAPAKIFSHQILSSDSEAIFLRSIDAIGTGGALFLVSFASEKDGSNSILFRIARISDPETGALELLPTKALAIPEVRDLKDGFVVSPKPGGDEYWVTDGSLNLWNIQILDDGSVGLRTEMHLPENLEVRGQEMELDGVQKMLFFDQSDTGILKFKTKDGREYISLFYLYSTPVGTETQDVVIAESPAVEDVEGQMRLFADDDVDSQGSQDLSTQENLSIDFDFARQIRPGATRMSVDPSKQLVYLSYPEELVIYYYSIEAQKLKLLKRLKMDELAPGNKLLGAEVYRSATEREIETEEGPQRVFVNPQSRLALILENRETGEIKIDWN